VDILDYLAPKAQGKNMTLHTSLAPDLPPVMMDVKGIGQVLFRQEGILHGATFTLELPVKFLEIPA
jgi:hypothetical protein